MLPLRTDERDYGGTGGRSEHTTLSLLPSREAPLRGPCLPSLNDQDGSGINGILDRALQHNVVKSPGSIR